MASQPTPSDSDRLEVLVAQYREAWSQIRLYDQLIWQTPAVALAIVSFLVGSLVVKGVSSYLVSFLVILAAILVTAVGTLQLRKHRFFQIAATEDLDHLEKAISRIVPDIQHISFKTDDIIRAKERHPDVSRCWLDRRSAYWALFWLLVAVTVGLSLLAVFMAAAGLGLIQFQFPPHTSCRRAWL